MRSATSEIDGKDMVGEEERTRRDGGKDDTANALVETSEQISIDGTRRGICVTLSEVGRLDSGLDSVQRVDQKIDGESSKGARNEDISIGVLH